MTDFDCNLVDSLFLALMTAIPKKINAKGQATECSQCRHELRPCSHIQNFIGGRCSGTPHSIDFWRDTAPKFIGNAPRCAAGAGRYRAGRGMWADLIARSLVDLRSRAGNPSLAGWSCHSRSGSHFARFCEQFCNPQPIPQERGTVYVVLFLEEGLRGRRRTACAGWDGMNGLATGGTPQELLQISVDCK